MRVPQRHVHGITRSNVSRVGTSCRRPPSLRLLPTASSAEQPTAPAAAMEKMDSSAPVQEPNRPLLGSKSSATNATVKPICKATAI